MEDASGEELVGMKQRIGRRHAELSERITSAGAGAGAGDGRDLSRVNWMQLVYGSGGLDGGSSAPDEKTQEGYEDEIEDEDEGQSGRGEKKEEDGGQGGEEDEARGARGGRLIADLFTRKRARRSKRDARAAACVKLDAIDSSALCPLAPAPARDWQLPAVADFDSSTSSIHFQ